MFRLFGCLVVQLFSCSAAQLFSCSAARRNRWDGRGTDRRLRRCRLHSGGSVRNRVPTRFPDQLSGPVSRSASGLAFRFAFRACFAICFGTGFRICFSGLLQDLLRDLLSDLFPGQLSGLASGSAFRMQVLFCLIVECDVWFRSGRRIRLRNFCRSSSRRRACNSLLPVFLDLRRVPMI